MCEKKLLKQSKAEAMKCFKEDNRMMHASTCKRKEIEIKNQQQDKKNAKDKAEI